MSSTILWTIMLSHPLSFLYTFLRSQHFIHTLAWHHSCTSDYGPGSWSGTWKGG